MLKEITQIETSTVIMEIRDDILYIIVKEDADLDLDAVVEAVEKRKELQAGKKMLVLVDNRKIWQISEAANKYSVSKEVGDLSIAMALLSGSSLPTRLISNFFIKFNKLHCPTRMFKSEAKARKWLLSFKS